MMKLFTNLIVTLLMLPMFSFANESVKSNQAIELLVFKTPNCGCCKAWITHIEDKGIVAYAEDYADISPIKNKLGIKPNHRSCHTAITEQGYAFEGHVPAKFIKQFLSESHPNAIGLSVPAMPIGSPGMEMGDKFMPYKVLILFNDGTSKVYAKVNSYKEQF